MAPRTAHTSSPPGQSTTVVKIHRAMPPVLAVVVACG